MSQVNFKHVFLILLCAGLWLTSCSQQVVKKSRADSLTDAWNKTVRGNFSGQSNVKFDSTQIAVFLKKYPLFISYSNQIVDFYRHRNFAFAWFDNGVLIEQAGNLSNRVMNMNTDGVYKSVPYLNALDSLLNGADVTTNGKKADINTELMLTAQYFIFSKLAWQGMEDSVSKSSGWYVPRKKVAYTSYLDSLLKEPSKQFPAGEPVYRQYELLRNFLRKYKALDATDNWAPIVISDIKLKLGDTSFVIAQVKSRLYKLGDYSGDTLNRVYDNGIKAALQQFQIRHGLVAAGLIDKNTIYEMNVPLKSRIKQILVNMERSRWLPVSLNADYVAVNIPEFKLHVYHADSLLWSCNVVVGQTVHQTSIFYGEIKYIVFSPYWNVPESIVKKEIIPGLKDDPSYIEKHQMEITGRVNGFPVVRQKPGPENSLGLIKFLFPNSYNIYLHDTPSKSLFNESSRAFSHGCIRVMEPVKLASFLLAGNKNWDLNKITLAMHSGKQQYLTLSNKVPVFIAYFTAFTDRNNKLNFRKDIYDLDQHLANMIIAGNGKY
jgi:murein L,D-transpeptidase YcbB/YkuD